MQELYELWMEEIIKKKKENLNVPLRIEPFFLTSVRAVK